MKVSRLAAVLLVATTAGCSAADERPDEVIVPDPIESVAPASSAGAAVAQRPSAAPDDIVLEAGEEKHVGIYGASFAEGHAFRGTYLELEDGKRVILSYGPVPEREVLIGKRVVAVGTPYVNEGRSIAGHHLKARIVQLAE